LFIESVKRFFLDLTLPEIRSVFFSYNSLIKPVAYLSMSYDLIIQDIAA